MFQPKDAAHRQFKACLTFANVSRFARVRVAIINVHTKLRQILVRIDGATLRKPSPWRRSGASLHPLPPFFLSAVAKPNFERVLLCQNQQRSSQHWSFPDLSQDAFLRIHKFKTLPVAQHLAQQQARLLAATKAKSSQAASLVPQQAHLSRTKHNFRFFPFLAEKLQTTCKRRFALIGQGGVFAFQISRKGLPHVQ